MFINYHDRKFLFRSFDLPLDDYTRISAQYRSWRDSRVNLRRRRRENNSSRIARNKWHQFCSGHGTWPSSIVPNSRRIAADNVPIMTARFQVVHYTDRVPFCDNGNDFALHVSRHTALNKGFHQATRMTHMHGIGRLSFGVCVCVCVMSYCKVALANFRDAHLI